MSPRSALREHWPEYLIEAWALGCFMISIGIFVTIFVSPMSPIYAWVPSLTLRAVMLGVALGATAIVLIRSPWGKRSGAHMNPAVTLALLRVRKIHPWDALFYVIAQAVGGILGVMLVAFALGNLFTDPPVSYAATVPGRGALPSLSWLKRQSPSCSWRQCSHSRPRRDLRATQL